VTAWRALAASTLLTCCAAAGQQGPQRFTYEQVHFGNIPVELSLYCDDAKRAAAAADAAFTLVAELDAMMSDYALDPPSPLNRIAAEAPAPVEVPAPLMFALTRAVTSTYRRCGSTPRRAPPRSRSRACGSISEASQRA
jgi:thiamine biosynthesis lipoprotein ApbE